MSIDLLLILIIIVLPLIAQLKVNTNYSKYSNIRNSMNLTGEQVAKMILERNGINDVSVCEIGGNLTDHYDPKRKVVNLSQSIYSNTSIASIAVAAHEVGHAIQHNKNYAFLRFRSNLVPIVNFTSKFASIFIIIGFATSILNIIDIGILLLSFGLTFQLITLPVEFNASNRAKIQLKNCGLISNSDIKGTNKVLKAAAFTYVAGFLATALQILRLFLASRSRN